MNWCRICRVKREESGKCSSCGTGLTPYREPKAKSANPPCPICKKKHSKATEYGTRICSDCGAEFEPVEVSFADTRPDINLEKKERR